MLIPPRNGTVEECRNDWLCKVVSTNLSILTPNNITENLEDEDDDESDIAWYARGGKRNSEVPCEGTAYFGGIHPEGTVRWKKSLPLYFDKSFGRYTSVPFDLGNTNCTLLPFDFCSLNTKLVFVITLLNSI
ncbi:MAG: hypothetical protein GEU26_14685 [Nitrososphaeraceae archaeon]|nr:hypothetical protein [Nitrososphaeraceae archaeon]